MPWKETDVGTQRIRFVVEVRQGRESVSAVCARYGISRKTGYKWLRRSREVKWLGELDEQSRRPHRSPSKTAEGVEERVVELRQLYGWGARKLRCLLAREGIELGFMTVHRILRRRGLLLNGEGFRPAMRRFEWPQPNELVQMDFKGEYALGPRSWCYPLSLVDDHSRFAVALRALPSQHGERVKGTLVECFQTYGVPRRILVDHGTPWWSSTNGHGLTRLGVFLIRQGVDLLYSGIAHPQTQGKVERFHRTLKAWIRHHGQPRTLDTFQAALDSFRVEYNEVRPHEALDFKTPSSRYDSSPRGYDEHPAEWEYPLGSEVRRVDHNGCIRPSARGASFVCHALAGERVRLERFEDCVLVSYRQMLVRELDLRTGRSKSILQPYGPTGH